MSSSLHNCTFAPATENDPYGILSLTATSGGAAGGGSTLAVLMDVFNDAAPAGDFAALSCCGRLARPGDVCPECRCALQVSGMEYECPTRHEIFEAADIQDVLPNSTPEMPGSASLRGRLCIVGPNAGESCEKQKKTTYAELLCLDKDYDNRGGNPFPKNVLQDIAEKYHIIQQEAVRRSMMKRGIIAALLFHTCILRGFTRPRAEAADFAKLPNHGIARGDDFLRSIDEDKGLDIDMNKDRLHPHIVTTFAHLDLAEKYYEHLRKAVADIVKIANGESIGFRSPMRSKVAATTAEVLRRKGMNITPMDVSVKYNIHFHTIRRFIYMLWEYHSHFEDTYRTYDLDASHASHAGA